MKHAGPEALERLEDLLSELRSFTVLREKTPGAFYWRSKAFLHFHDDPTGLYADLKVDSEFLRLPVNSRAERRALIGAVRDRLSQA